MAREGTKTALVLACGSLLRGDDGVAWRIGEALEAIAGQGVAVVYTELLLPEHAALLSRAEVAIFLDCSASTEPGEVTTIDLSPARSLPRMFTHHLHPESLLALAEELYGRIPARSVAITVGGESFALNDGLTARWSETVEAAVPIAVEAAAAVLASRYDDL